jgi:hypothetical protein
MTISVKIRYVVFYALFFMFSLFFTLEASAQDVRLTREEIARKREAAEAEKRALPEVAKDVASFFKNSLLYKHYSVKEYGGNESGIVVNGTRARFAIKSLQAVQNGLDYDGKVYKGSSSPYTGQVIFEDVKFTITLIGNNLFTLPNIMEKFDTWSISYETEKHLYGAARNIGGFDHGALQHLDAAIIVRVKGGDIDGDPQQKQVAESIESYGYKRIGKTNFLYTANNRPSLALFNLVPVK